MQLKYAKNIQAAVDGMQKISALAWSPNGKKMAISTADRIIHLYDENGEKKDKFPTKASEKGQKSYVIRGMEFSPDSMKIAIAQSDNIVFIYKLGTEWGERKSICNKFPVSSSVTCLTWPKDRHGELVFGLAEGKVRVGILRSNNSKVLYSTESYVVSVASSRDGQFVCSGHLDGSIYAFNLESQSGSKIVTYTSVPYALGWGENIVAAGSDAKVAFFDFRGNLIQKFDYTNDDKIKDFTLACFNPGGETLVLGNFNRFYIYTYNSRRTQWEELGVKHIDNYYSVTALCWKNDGSKLVTGSLCGSVDVFDASMKKVKYKGKFEFNYVAPNQVIVKALADGSRSVVKSKIAPEITKINIFQDRYVVAHTIGSLLLGDLSTNRISEIQWRGSGNEKFDFSNPNVCMIFNAGELLILEYGNDEILGTCRTEHMRSNLLSARISYQGKDENATSTKMIAYLLDLQTILIQDLSTNSYAGQINHDAKIDFVELNSHANKLLFRDKRRQLYLYNIKTQSKNTLLNYCNYAQWVPDSEVVVAQNRSNLCVWYSIENPDKVTIYNIKGDVESIERVQGKTEVVVNDGSNPVSYTLDEPLIEFGFAIESGDLERAAEILDPLEMNPETEANWKVLAKIAVEHQNIVVAERCYSAMGDIPKARYLHNINKLAQQYHAETGKNGVEYYKVQAKLAVLEKQFYKAEQVYLEHNEIEEAMEMYQEVHKWDESIRIAVKKNHPDVRDYKANYFQWLMDTNQEEKAAEVKENEGDYVEAIKLYLKANLPARAATVVSNYQVNYGKDLLERIATTLASSQMFEKAGEFYEKMDQLQAALDMYCKGHAYGRAVELSRRAAPSLVVRLQEQWGDWLVSQRQTENAINHYIEAAANQKAIEAAISARQWGKAVQLLQNQSTEVARPFYKQIAQHYADVRQLDLAEKYFLKAGAPKDVFEIYIRANKWDQAFRVARDNFPDNDIVKLYVQQAQMFEGQGSYKEAEKLYMTVEEPDLAINMYKKAAQWDHMVRLVSKHKKNLLKDTHLFIAQKLEREGNHKQAESHYIESGAWHGAVQMYQNAGNWEEAIRVCKVNGTDKETCELAKKWAESLGPEVGMRMLLKLNLVDAVIDFLTDNKDFNEAFKMAQNNAKHKVSDVHLKYAMYLEDENRYKEAEEHFIKAGRPNEAVHMYEVQKDFHSALQVARQYDPQSVPAIFTKQGEFFIERRDYQKAEQCFIQGRKPERAIRMYTDIDQYPEAIRVAKKHAPNLVGEINEAMVRGGRGGGGGGVGIENMSGEEILRAAKMFEEARDWTRAIDTYLEVRKEHFPDADILEGAWQKAATIAHAYDKERYLDIINIICKRLRDIKRFASAGEYYESVGAVDEAVGCYLAGNFFDKAKECVQQVRSPQDAARLNDLISKAYKVHLKNAGEAESLIDQGETDSGLMMLVQKGEWGKALDFAAQKGGKVLSQYLTEYAKMRMKEGKFGEAIAAFAKYGLPAQSTHFPLYKTLAMEIFADCDQREVAHLRQALFPLLEKMEQSGEASTPAGRELAKYLFVAHLLCLKDVFERKKLTNLYTKTSISLLRYCDLIRMDKLYLEAGKACQRNGQDEAAFVFLNRYLDVYDVIEDSETSNIDNTDFANTDIPSPYDVPLPDKNLISENEKEKIKDWILQKSMSLTGGKAHLPTRTCGKCGKPIWEAAITCPMCKTVSEACVITGYPLTKDNSFRDESGKGARKDAWSEYNQNFPYFPWTEQLPN